MPNTNSTVNPESKYRLRFFQSSINRHPSSFKKEKWQHPEADKLAKKVATAILHNIRCELLRQQKDPRTGRSQLVGQSWHRRRDGKEKGGGKKTVHHALARRSSTKFSPSGAVHLTGLFGKNENTICSSLAFLGSRTDQVR